MSEQQEKPKKKKPWALLFVLVNVIAIVIIALVEFNDTDRPTVSFGEILSILGANWQYVLFAVAGLGVMLLCEVLKYVVMLHSCTGKIMVKESFEVAILGKYYDYITPSGTGGQPFQMYYLNKAGLATGIAGSIPVMGFFTTQISFIVIALTLFIVNHSVLDSQAASKAAAYFGLVCFSLIPLLFILFSIFPRFTTRILRWFVRVGGKLRLVKNADATSAKVEKYFADYRSNLYYLTKNIWSLLLAFALAIGMQLATSAVPYFVMRACGVSDVSLIDIVTLSFFVYAAITFIPTPGNSGVAEGAFVIIFSALSSGVLFWAMLMWRFLTFYIFIILGLITVAVTSFQKKSRYEIRSLADDINDTVPPDNND